MHLARLTTPRCLLALLAAGGLLPRCLGQTFGFDFKLDLGEVQQALGALPPSLCGTYAAVANYSAIGADPRMRAALQDAGADTAAGRARLGRLLDACGRAVGQFADNAAVNARCGNLSAVAHDEAARNFSRGIVGNHVVGGGPDTGGSVADSAAAVVLAPWADVVGAVVLVSIGVGLL